MQQLHYLTQQTSMTHRHTELWQHKPSTFRCQWIWWGRQIRTINDHNTDIVELFQQTTL